MKYEANEMELQKIESIINVNPCEYTLIRLTSTMHSKSIIDAGEPVRKILREGKVIDYNEVVKGEEGKQIKCVYLITDEVHELEASFYRPKTKKGDPRFWVYGLKKFINIGELFFITTFNNSMVLISLQSNLIQNNVLKQFFGPSKLEIREELIALIRNIKQKGPVISVSPNKLNSKDIGDTLEREVGILPNSSGLADYKGSIELKAKRKDVKTNDTLFSMVPDWSKCLIKSSNTMILEFGYPSNKYEGFIDLFVTVSNNPNNQGLYLEVNEDAEKVSQFYMNPRGEKIEVCFWEFDALEGRLKEKHPSTLWMLADISRDGNGQIHFHYNQAMMTRTPIFSSFLLLISQGIITYDWRGRVREDGSGYKDKGHCFRLKPKYRNILFASTEIIDI